MASGMRRIGEYLGLLEDTGTYDEYDAEAYEAREAREANSAEPARPEPRREQRPAVVSDLSERRGRPAGTPSVVAESSRIITVHPRTYNEARTVGEHYRDGIPVIMNLSEMDDSDAKRLVDFGAGMIFATHGTIERVTNKVFLLSPPNVSVAAEDKRRLAEGGFFNQS